MIKKSTALEIWKAHQEIETAEALLAKLQDARRQVGLQLGVPSGDGSLRVYDVNPALATAILKAHIAEKRATLEALDVQAFNETFDGGTDGGDTTQV